MCDMNKNQSGCTDCGCEGSEKKAHFHHALEPVWSKMPDELKDEVRGLDKQKLAVMEDVKKWADKNNEEALSEACEKKIVKVQKRLDSYES